MSQSNDTNSIPPDSSDKFFFEYESIRLIGYYKPYKRLNNRRVAEITMITSILSERMTMREDPNHTRSGHLRPALLAFENLCHLEELWAVIVIGVVNDFLPRVLERYGYKYIASTRDYEKLLRGFTIKPQNDLKEYHKKLLSAEVETDPES